jgi:hypothetical protein
MVGMGFEPKEGMMLSPSKFFVACANINERVKAARRIGDDAEIRRCAVELGARCIAPITASRWRAAPRAASRCAHSTDVEIASMRCRVRHPRRLLPTWTLILLNLGKPKFSPRAPE